MNYYFADHLGTARVVTDAAGNTQDDSDFCPFGKECYFITSSSSNTYKFTGKERDSESGLDDFGARYYSSQYGRFATPDWSASPTAIPYADFGNPQSFNLYGYVKNKPLAYAYADPDGHCCSLDDMVNFVGGLTNAYGSDNLAGAGRQEQTTGAGRKGQVVGDFIAGVQGDVEVLLGAGGEIAGTALDTTGVGALVGVPANVLSAGLIAHGGTTAAEGGGHLLKSSVENNSGNAPYENTPENQERMKEGKAPIGKDGKPVELHHEGQNADGQVREMTQTDHRLGDNFKKNHSNTGQQSSQIDRNQANQAQRKHWWSVVKGD